MHKEDSLSDSEITAKLLEFMLRNRNRMRGSGFEPLKALSHRALNPACSATPATPHKEQL